MSTRCFDLVDVEQQGQEFKITSQCKTKKSLDLTPKELMDVCCTCLESIKKRGVRYFSPSATDKFRRCLRLYAFEYNEKIKPPPSDKQEFGLEVHKQLERWLKKGKRPDDSSAGLTAQQAIDKGWLPKPNPKLLVESMFEFSIRKGLGIAGYIDCLVPPEITGAEPLIIDHKTTSDLRWAKSEEELLLDPQVLIYCIRAMLLYKSPKARARWIYYAASNPKDGSPRKPRGAKPVEVLISNQNSKVMGVIENLVTDLEAMAVIRKENKSGLSFEPNPEACGRFGGCPHLDRCNLTPGDKLAAYISRGY
jgi:hypothetical protein